MSRADLYKKFRKGDLDKPELDVSEDSKLNLSKGEAKKSAHEPSMKPEADSKPDHGSSQGSSEPRATVVITKGNRPVADKPAPEEPDDTLKAEKRRPKSTGPSLFSMIGSAIGYLLPATLGIGLALGMVALIYGSINAATKSMDKPKVANQKPYVQQEYQAPRHPTTDFFITDDGELVKRTSVKNIKRIGTVISTDPQHLAKRVKTGKYTKTVVDRTHNPLTADFTYLILDNGDRLPVSIGLPWLKNPVALYGAVHGYTQRRMICLARPINKCAYLHQF